MFLFNENHLLYIYIKKNFVLYVYIIICFKVQYIFVTKFYISNIKSDFLRNVIKAAYI